MSHKIVAYASACIFQKILKHVKIFLLNIFKYEISRKKIKGKKKIIVQKSCQMFVIASAESDNDCGGTLADMEMAKQQKKK